MRGRGRKVEGKGRGRGRKVEGRGRAGEGDPCQ